MDVDDTPPLITLYGESNLTHEAGNPYIDFNASWSDAVDGSGVIVASVIEVNASDPGTYILSYNYTDGAGNVAQTVTRTVHVVDTAPVISLYGDSNITHEAGNPNIDFNASWSDAVG